MSTCDINGFPIVETICHEFAAEYDELPVEVWQTVEMRIQQVLRYVNKIGVLDTQCKLNAAISDCAFDLQHTPEEDCIRRSGLRFHLLVLQGIYDQL